MVASKNGTGLLSRRSELAALCRAIEAECLADPDGAHLFAGFPHPGPYHRNQRTWQELAARARSAFVFSTFRSATTQRPGRPVEVDLEPGAGHDPVVPVEWVLIADRPRGPVALAARERPGQEHLPTTARLFDSAWTTDPRTVRRAAHLYALAAEAAGAPGAEAVAEELALPHPHPRPDPDAGERLLDRFLPLLEELATLEPLDPLDPALAPGPSHPKGDPAMTNPVLITLEAAEASDSWGFVGVVKVGEFEAYRTIRAYTAPTDALMVAQKLLADVLGALMAGQEWRTAADEFGHSPRRTELGLGFPTPGRAAADREGSDDSASS